MTTASPPSTRTAFRASLLPRPVTDLLDQETATQFFTGAGLEITRARPDYLRHKPGETTIISYRFDTAELGTEALGYAHWCATTERADDIYRKAITLRPRMAAVGVSILRADDHTVFYGFPNDARLRRLRWYATPRKLKSTLTPLTPIGARISKRHSTSTVLKYKPERRLVTRVDLAVTGGADRSLLVRYTTGRHAYRLAAVANRLLANGVRTPAPRAQLDDGRVGVDDFIDGVELRTWLLGQGSVADQLAASLQAFHSTEAPVGVPVRTEADDLANAINGLLALSLWDRQLGRMARTVASRLTAAQPEPTGSPGLIHGDLHDKNVLVNDEQPWFIDLERTAVGSPASDLGRLRAHAISLDVRQPGWSPTAIEHAEQVIDAYRTRSAPLPASIDDRTLGWHCAIALVDQALLVVRHVEDGWPVKAGTLLAAAAAALRPATSHPSESDRGSHQT